jgi:hypothetical protein
MVQAMQINSPISKQTMPPPNMSLWHKKRHWTIKKNRLKKGALSLPLFFLRTGAKTLIWKTSSLYEKESNITKLEMILYIQMLLHGPFSALDHFLTQVASPAQAPLPCHVPITWLFSIQFNIKLFGPNCIFLSLHFLKRAPMSQKLTLNKFLCFSPINLSYVNLFSGPVNNPKRQR